jgi:hypothetical protein
MIVGAPAVTRAVKQATALQSGNIDVAPCGGRRLIKYFMK